MSKITIFKASLLGGVALVIVIIFVAIPADVCSGYVSSGQFIKALLAYEKVDWSLNSSEIAAAGDFIGNLTIGGIALFLYTVFVVFPTGVGALWIDFQKGR